MLLMLGWYRQSLAMCRHSSCWWQTTVCVILQTGKSINMDDLARKPHAERAKLGLLACLLACYVKIAVINLRISGKYRASALLARVTNPNRA